MIIIDLRVVQAWLTLLIIKHLVFSHNLQQHHFGTLFSIQSMKLSNVKTGL